MVAVVRRRTPLRRAARRAVTRPASPVAQQVAAALLSSAASRDASPVGGAAGVAAPAPQGIAARSRERALEARGFARVAGVDEAGRGPLAGPVVAAACVVPQHVRFPGVDDSKKLSEAQREALFEAIVQHPDVAHSVAVVSAAEIDRVNILQATLLGMERAVAALAPDAVLVDGPHAPQGITAVPCEAVVKGDSSVYSIACASVVAKVTRDRLMCALDATYPAYGFARHKGYPTQAHMAALMAAGPCEAHRRSFAPVRRAIVAHAEARGEEALLPPLPPSAGRDKASASAAKAGKQSQAKGKRKNKLPPAPQVPAKRPVTRTATRSSKRKRAGQT